MSPSATRTPLTPTQPLHDAVRDADVVIVATNHSAFERPETLKEILALACDDCLLVDPWNTLGTAQVFAYAAEATALLDHATSVDAAPDSGH